jgi:2-polyprenyl-3-methyl-5-hydroxy-6-metoxy-1,4-benzoquinol methylase
MWHTPTRLDPAQAPAVFGGSPEAVAESLGKLARANRHFGGTQSLLAPLYRLIAAGSRDSVHLLDVGCGRADQVRALILWARRRGLRVQVLAVDRDAEVVRRTREALRTYSEASVVMADARRLPFQPRSFDYVTASMLLHYFSQEEAVALLRSWADLASRALLVNDVERHWFPLLALRILGRVSQSNLFQESSRRTVLRGFTPHELHGLAGAAGLAGAQVRRHFPFRLTLVVPCTRPSVDLPAGHRVTGGHES